jgi:hypothetical protein
MAGVAHNNMAAPANTPEIAATKDFFMTMVLLPGRAK